MLLFPLFFLFQHQQFAPLGNPAAMGTPPPAIISLPSIGGVPRATARSRANGSEVHTLGKANDLALPFKNGG